jgi:hypothetical protein
MKISNPKRDGNRRSAMVKQLCFQWMLRHMPEKVAAFRDAARKKFKPVRK